MFPTLQAEIARKGWAASYLAELVGMVPSNLSAKMKGKYGFSLEDAKKIKKALGVDMSIDQLFEWVEKDGE